MLHFETQTDQYTDSFSGFSAPPESVLFFDIETTGFSGDSAYVYLIGAAFLRDGRVRLRQWFMEDVACEKELISCFLTFAADFSVLVHYNGAAVDVPFRQKRCRRYRLADRLSALSQSDLYRLLLPRRRLLGLADLKQKTVEQRIGLQRADRFSGGDLISVYTEFLGRYRYERLRSQHSDTPDFSNTGLTQMPESPAKALLCVLLLHNREDLTGLLSIAPLGHALAVLESASGWEDIPETASGLSALPGPKTSSDSSAFPDVPEKTAAAVFRLQNSVSNGIWRVLFPEPVSRLLPLPPAPSADISAGADSFEYNTVAVTLSAEVDGSLTLSIPYLCGTLKYFFDDYKNYYYLPLEDRAIHKSVAEFVDKAYRKKATQKTCYQKKSGCFLPQAEDVFTPALRLEPKDSLSFFEPGDTFSEPGETGIENALLRDPERRERWLAGLLRWVLA
ncbi:MAG: ribonuclease H-like domain-containing protein [Lachnospiraceae bacterium]|nr:ribonuclease H-like domain-containing protein [Lachnospiraceae bacterium]